MRGLTPFGATLLLLFLSATTFAGDLVVNGASIDPEVQRAMEAELGQRIPDGRYWYDSACGAWGLEGGPALGLTVPGRRLGGTLRADASGGSSRGRQTWVWVNGRELHPLDVMQLSQLIPVSPGRYWLDAQGFAGYEGGPALLNLWQLARGGGGGGSAYQRRTAGGYIGGDGNTSYFFDPESGASVMVD